jgi:DNA mismatch endonuclease (patch repair protein)
LPRNSAALSPSERMRRVRRTQTAPELAIGELLSRLRIEFEQDVPPGNGIRSRPDFLFREHHLAVFVDGCFWHSCPQHATLPKSNAYWWTEKLRSNAERDARVSSQLVADGWRVFRVWAHESPQAVALTIASAISEH